MAANEGAILAVFNTVYATLTADTTLMALAIGGVHNDVPEDALYPHVLITRPREVPNHTFGGSSVGLGWIVNARVYTYSRYEGDREALLIHGRIVSLLNKWNDGPSVSGFSSACWEYNPGVGDVKNIEKLEAHWTLAEFDVTVKQ